MAMLNLTMFDADREIYYRKKMVIIGFCGKAGHGKDTMANYIVELFKNHHHIKINNFAKPLKDFAKSIGFTESQLYDPDKKDTEINEHYDVTARKALQFIGTDLMRNQFNENVWTNAMAQDIINARHAAVEIYIVTDVRYNNEAILLRDFGAYIFKVVKIDNDSNPSSNAKNNFLSSWMSKLFPKSWFYENAKPHVSEQGIREDYITDTFKFNAGDMSNMKKAAKELVVNIMSGDYTQDRHIFKA
jgi:dephospho-CoA kinase